MPIAGSFHQLICAGAAKSREAFAYADNAAPRPRSNVDFQEQFSWVVPRSRRLSAPADAAGVPAAPAHASETLKSRCERPLGSLLMGSDASLRFSDLSLQVGYGFLRLAARTGDIAGPEPGRFQGLHGVTVLLDLNPVPSDVAIAVSNHVAAPATDLETRYFSIG